MTLSLKERLLLVALLAVMGAGVAGVLWGFSPDRAGRVVPGRTSDPVVVTFPSVMPK